MHDAPACVDHGNHPTKTCINCKLPLCPQCHRYDINSRPWCYGCGSQKVPGGGAAAAGLAITAGKVLVVLLVGLLVVNFVRGISGFVVTVFVMSIVAKFLFVRDKITDARIEEYKNGICVRE